MAVPSFSTIAPPAPPRLPTELNWSGRTTRPVFAPHLDGDLPWQRPATGSGALPDDVDLSARAALGDDNWRILERLLRPPPPEPRHNPYVASLARALDAGGQSGTGGAGQYGELGRAGADPPTTVAATLAGGRSTAPAWVRTNDPKAAFAAAGLPPELTMAGVAPPGPFVPQSAPTFQQALVADGDRGFREAREQLWRDLNPRSVADILDPQQLIGIKLPSDIYNLAATPAGHVIGGTLRGFIPDGRDPKRAQGIRDTVGDLTVGLLTPSGEAKVGGEVLSSLAARVVPEAAEARAAEVAEGAAAKAVRDAVIPRIGKRRPMNYRLAGTTHPLGVPFRETGFPNYDSFALHSVSPEEGLTGSYRTDTARANREAGLTATPEGYSWHHVEDCRTMQLIPRRYHAIAHTGGVAVMKHGLCP